MNSDSGTDRSDANSGGDVRYPPLEARLERHYAAEPSADLVLAVDVWASRIVDEPALTQHRPALLRGRNHRRSVS